MHHPILEGTWEEVAKKAAGLKRGTRVRLEVIEAAPKGKRLTFGMFRELGQVTEEDFKAAEWRPPTENGI